MLIIKTPKKKFKICCHWEMVGYAIVEADTMAEAHAIAQEDDFPLPTNSDYVMSSFDVDEEFTEEVSS